MSACIDSFLADQHMAALSVMSAREDQIDALVPTATADLMIDFSRAFSGKGNGIAFPLKRADGYPSSVTLLDLDQAVAETWGNKRVDQLFNQLMTCDPEMLNHIRSSWQTAVAMAYADLHAEALAIHRADFPEVYA